MKPFYVIATKSEYFHWSCDASPLLMWTGSYHGAEQYKTLREARTDRKRVREYIAREAARGRKPYEALAKQKLLIIRVRMVFETVT